MSINALGKIKTVIISSYPCANDADTGGFHVVEEGVLLLGSIGQVGLQGLRQPRRPRRVPELGPEA
jgi:hypothetical protein